MKQDFSLVAAVVSRNKSPPWLLRLLSRVDEHLNCWLDDKYDPQLFMEMLEPAIDELEKPSVSDFLCRMSNECRSQKSKRRSNVQRISLMKKAMACNSP